MCLVAQPVGNAGGNSYLYIVDDTYANRKPRFYKNYSPTLRAERFGLKVVSNKKDNNEIIKLFDIPKEILNDNERQRRVYSSEGIAPTVLSRTDSAKILVKQKEV